MPFNNFNPPFRQQHKIQRCLLVQIVKSLFHVSTHSPKDIQTSVIYWGIIWSPVAWNISGLGLLASTQNDVWSEELHLWKKHHKLCPGFISKCILQKNLWTLYWSRWNWIETHLHMNTHSVSLPDQHHFLSIQRAPRGRPATDTDRGGNGKKRGFG